MKSSHQLTKEIKTYAENQKIDIFGISGVNIINEHARKGRRPMDLFPSAKSVLIFGCGMADPFTRGWVSNGKGGEHFSLTLSELENRKWKLIAFLRKAGFQSFGGEMHGGGMLESGLCRKNGLVPCHRSGLSGAGESSILSKATQGRQIRDLSGYPDFDTNLCGDCRICLDECPAGALSELGYDAQRCTDYREDSDHQNRIATHSIEKCHRCMACCPIGKRTHWE